MIKREILSFSSKIVDDIRSNKKWICYGAGETFRRFIQQYCIQTSKLPLPEYVCDNNAEIWGTKICGVPVCSSRKLLEENSENAIICISTVLPLSIMEDLMFKLNRHYFFIIPIKQLISYLYFVEHCDKVEQVYQFLDDDVSKQTYAGFWELSIAGITNYAGLYSANAYWGNDIVPALKNGWDVLYAGAYDGKHIDRALKCNKNIVFHGFEPNQTMYQVLLKKYEGWPQVKLYPYALGSIEEELYIDTKKALSAKIVQDDIHTNQTEKILCSTIDKQVGRKLDLIALDIEGFEPNALKGAKNTIQQYRPILAICVYHEISHYVDIPLYIKQLNPSYKLYFRHYSVTPFESVIYAINS